MGVISTSPAFSAPWMKVIGAHNWDMSTGGNAQAVQQPMPNPTDTFIANGESHQQEAGMMVGSFSSPRKAAGTSILIKASGTGNERDKYRITGTKIFSDELRKSLRVDEGMSEEKIDDLERLSAELELLEKMSPKERARFKRTWKEARESGTPITSLKQLGLLPFEMKIKERMERFSRLVELNAPTVIIAGELRLILNGMHMELSDDFIKISVDPTMEAPYLKYAYEILHEATGLEIRFSRLTELDPGLRRFFARLEKMYT